MAGYDRQIITGDPGTVWTNDTGTPRYQFFASLVNTCGACLQYHMRIGPFWGIPLHYGCRCRQVLVPVGARAPHPFVDYEQLLDGMPADQQKAAVGASCWKLIEQGVVDWKDVVTPWRVRSLREVVALKRLSVQRMTDAGVKLPFAERAHASVNTPVHQVVAAQRAALQHQLEAAGIPAQALADELARRLAARLSIVRPPPTGGGEPIVERFKTGGSTAAELAKWLIAPGITRAAMGPRPPRKPAARAPEPIPAPAVPAIPIDTYGPVAQHDVDLVARTIEMVPRGAVERVRDHGDRIVLARRISDYNPRLAAETPRGWPPDRTFEHAGACYDEQNRRMILAVQKRRGAGYENQNLAAATRHEFGHALDLIAGLSRDARFIAAYNTDVGRLSREQFLLADYCIQPGAAGHEEAFAEVFAAVFAADRPSWMDAAEMFPHCARLVEDLAKRGFR